MPFAKAIWGPIFADIGRFVRGCVFLVRGCKGAVGVCKEGWGERRLEAVVVCGVSRGSVLL